MSAISQDNLKKILKKYFWFEDFHPDQWTQIKEILKWKDTLSIIPTWAGKSLIFQYPSLLLKGTTIVISPFISLMKNQVDKMDNPIFDEIDNLNKIWIKASFLNSTLDWEEKNKVIRAFLENKLKLLYISPERFCDDTFIEILWKVRIPMIVIDEAHLVYQYQNFRPEYLLLWKYIDILKNKQDKKIIISAFTATATKRTENFIKKYLKLQEPSILKKEYYRSNLYYITKEINSDWNSEDVKRKTLLKLVKMYQNVKWSKIIFTTTIKQSQEINKALKLLWYKTDAYYSEIKKDKKDKIQENFMSNKYDFLVATSAFWTWVDKSDIRLIIHYWIPLSVEQYAQETWRSWRDWKNSVCIMLYSKKDILTSKFLIRSSSWENITENLNDFEEMLKLWSIKEEHQLFLKTFFN